MYIYAATRENIMMSLPVTWIYNKWSNINLHEKATEIRGQVNVFGISGLILHSCQEVGGVCRREDISFLLFQPQCMMKSDRSSIKKLV